MTVVPGTLAGRPREQQRSHIFQTIRALADPIGSIGSFPTPMILSWMTLRGLGHDNECRV